MFSHIFSVPFLVLLYGLTKLSVNGKQNLIEDLLKGVSGATFSYYKNVIYKHSYCKMSNWCIILGIY